MTSSSIRSRIMSGFESYLNRQQPSSLVEFSEAKIAMASEAKSLPQIVQQYHFQKIIRPLWGKYDLAKPAIGDHPDFTDLAGTNNVEYCPIATLFMDIESSTRLGVIYNPEEVFKIKNAFIATAIEVIQSFDGHIHRIMGDAVMAFFGGREVIPENAVLKALNAAAMIQYIVKKAIIPKLNEAGFENQFGIRIGLDYGSQNEVLWSSYGFPGSNEVTATSFFVDSASKLQHAAPRNSVMIGQSLRDFISFPFELLSIKKTQSGGQLTEEPYLLPNITDREKKPINYRQYIFNSLSYLDYSPLSPYDSDEFSSQTNFPSIMISVHTASAKNGQLEDVYTHCGSFIAKEKWLCFEIKYTADAELRMPLKVRFAVENHGEEANKDPNNGNHYTDIDIKTNASFRYGIKHWEYCCYRGLHYMTVSLYSQGAAKFVRKFGICIS